MSDYKCECDRLAGQIQEHAEPRPRRFPAKHAVLTDYAHLARRKRWVQRWDPETRTLQEDAFPCEGEVWSDALETAFREHDAVRIPASLGTIRIDRPLSLASGQALQVEPGCVIRQIPGPEGTPMLQNRACIARAGRDRDILVEGGIWDGVRNDGRGRIGMQPGAFSGALSFGRIDGLTVTGVTLRDIDGFGCQIADATGFRTERIRFDHTADGVHINGPASDGVIRDLAGHTTDDPVSLTAWDWLVGSHSFGTIRRILVEDIALEAGETWAEIRLLPGVRRRADGGLESCDIDECVFRRIHGIHTFKLYEQPSWYDVRDRSEGPGRLGRIFFRDIGVAPIDRANYYDKSSDALFDICVDAELLSLDGLEFPEPPGTHGSAPFLASIGPKSMVIPVGGLGDRNPGKFKDLFHPGSCPTVETLEIGDVHIAGTRCSAAGISGLVNVRSRLPQTLPIASAIQPACTGHGTLLRLVCR